MLHHVDCRHTTAGVCPLRTAVCVEDSTLQPLSDRSDCHTLSTDDGKRCIYLATCLEGGPPHLPTRPLLRSTTHEHILQGFYKGFARVSPRAR
jgi:hypothetical protein